jgi:hypothetical protein
MKSELSVVKERQSKAPQGPWTDLALHTVGWKAFQDLCAQVCEEIWTAPVETYYDSNDGGQDGAFSYRRGTSDEVIEGTIQCKFSSNSAKSIRASDLNSELDKITKLVEAGAANEYILMTSMSLSGVESRKIRTKIKERGVKKVHVFGRQYLTRVIRSSAKLRALVPQVYGLGDLSIILDERQIQQTLAMLEDWLPKLKKYVPTKPHRKAVSVIDKHGAVLLIGNPSTGKSAIGAMLSTLASEKPDRSVVKLTSPAELNSVWNPNDKGRFFWIDDAFGSNTLREDYVNDWMAIFPKVVSAIHRGNKFLLTSRRHIYEAAKNRLGSRNLNFFSSGQAVVDVGHLERNEKAQILYNHLRFGNQTASWKRAVKPFLDKVVEIDAFLPGIAERLGDQSFTQRLPNTQGHILQFMQKPEAHLIQTLEELEQNYLAALLLVYVHEGRLNLNDQNEVAVSSVEGMTQVQHSTCLASLADLAGSFVNLVSKDEGRAWVFAHPTISDAITAILTKRHTMVSALVLEADRKRS